MATSTTPEQRVFLEFTFKFIWDSWEDQVMIPETSNTEQVPRESIPTDWINILDILEGPIEEFIPLYLACLRLAQPLPEIYPAPTNANAQPETSDGPECTICGSVMTLQFQECTHGACGSCVSSLYRSRIQHQYFPKWFPCPLCRTEVHHVGTLSPESEIETQNGTVPKWITVQRWVAVHSGNGEDIAKGLKELATGGKRYYTITLNQLSWGLINGEIRSIAKSEVLRMRAAAAADRLKNWDIWVGCGFRFVGEYYRVNYEGMRSNLLFAP